MAHMALQALTRGVLCNWLVCCAVWMAGAASSLPGKAIAAFLPVCAFITMGLEHSVANVSARAGLTVCASHVYPLISHVYPLLASMPLMNADASFELLNSRGVVLTC